MRQHKATDLGEQIQRGEKHLNRLRRLYFKIFPGAQKRKPAIAKACYNLMKRPVNRQRKKQQDAWFPEMKQEILRTKNAMVFLVPETDQVTGGLMSICHLATRSQQMENLHGCKVLLATPPGELTITGYSSFDCDWRVFRMEQIEELSDCLESIFFQVPDVYIAVFLGYLKRHGKRILNISNRRLNILNQNIEMMPEPKAVRDLAHYFTFSTQTCAHEKYCTTQNRERYGMPLHLLPADIPGRFYQIPYREKENLIAYSNDENPHKAYVLAELKKRLPDYKFLMIENMSFEEYKRTISLAKWTLTFGEGWDGYYIQPYFSNSIGFTVFNEAFCPPRMKVAPTVFPDYETLPERMTEFIRRYDSEEFYSQKIAETMAILFPPPPPDVVPHDALLELYKGNYTIP